MKIIGVIPARYQSSRFPGKPLALINGKPMIWWVYKQVEKVKEFSEVYVATDSESIHDFCEKNKMNVLMTSSSHNTGTDRLGEVAEKIKGDFYVNIQGDEPLIEPAIIREIIDYKIGNPYVDVINTSTLLQNSDDVKSNTIVKVVATESNDLMYLSRSPIPYSKKGEEINYYKHLGLYGISREALMFFSKTERSFNEKIEDIEMMRFLENGYKIKILKVNSNTIGVDKPEDIKKVEKVISSLKERGKNEKY